MIARMIFATVLALPLAAAAQIAAQPQLEQRNAQRPPDAPALDSKITTPVTIPQEAWGHFTFGRQLDLLEIDLEPNGQLTGYITLLGDKALKGTDKSAPLTFFFAKSRVGGDAVYFLTQEIHRTSYEFMGTMESAPPPDKTLYVTYSLNGTLTVHRRDEGGRDHPETRQVAFKRVPDRLH